MDIRCFISIELPESLKKSIGNTVDTLKKSEADVKWVTEENIHITLKFLGRTDEALIIPIKTNLHKKLLHYSAFYIRIADAGCFPNIKHPRVIWIGLKESELLENLYKDIESEMVKLGFTQEKRDFSPHLTIGRVRSQKRIPGLIKILDEFSANDFGTIQIKSIFLKKSELNPAGAKYYTLAEIPFGRRNDVEQRVEQR